MLKINIFRKFNNTQTLHKFGKFRMIQTISGILKPYNKNKIQTKIKILKYI